MLDGRCSSLAVYKEFQAEVWDLGHHPELVLVDAPGVVDFHKANERKFICHL